MSDEVSISTTEAVKKTSDGMVKISVEKYEDLLETVATQKGRISSLNSLLTQVRNEPPVIHKTIVEKTPEILSQEHRAWGTTFMGLGAAFFIVGAIRYRAGRTAS